MILGIPIFPISVPKGWALPIIGICVALVVVLVGGSMLANRRRRKKRDDDKPSR
jgi:uncharacterized protein YneF (UPF0154 family)